MWVWVKAHLNYTTPTPGNSRVETIYWPIKTVQRVRFARKRGITMYVRKRRIWRNRNRRGIGAYRVCTSGKRFFFLMIFSHYTSPQSFIVVSNSRMYKITKSQFCALYPKQRFPLHNSLRFSRHKMCLAASLKKPRIE